MIIPPDVEETTLLEIGSSVEALVVRLTRVTERLLNGLPSLKVVGRNGVGVDNIDISAATASRKDSCGKHHGGQ